MVYDAAKADTVVLCTISLSKQLLSNHDKIDISCISNLRTSTAILSPSKWSTGWEKTGIKVHKHAILYEWESAQWITGWRFSMFRDVCWTYCKNYIPLTRNPKRIHSIRCYFEEVVERKHEKTYNFEIKRDTRFHSKIEKMPWSVNGGCYALWMVRRMGKTDCAESIIFWKMTKLAVWLFTHSPFALNPFTHTFEKWAIAVLVKSIKICWLLHMIVCACVQHVPHVC